MKRKILFRCLLGALIGLVLNDLITVGISLGVNDGYYHAAASELIRDCHSEINAVLIQSLCSILYGAGWGYASFIWEMDNWSLMKMTLIHLLATSLFTFPIAYCMYWMEHSMQGILSYFTIFLAIYVVIWFSQYSSIKKKLRMINAHMDVINQRHNE